MIIYQIPLSGLKISTNKIYAGTHWSKRKQIKDSILGYVGHFCRPVSKVKSYPIKIEYRFYFESRPLDTLNCAFMAKMFEDALCTIGVIQADDPKFVETSILSSYKWSGQETKKETSPQGKKINAKNNDHVIITINEYDKI